MSTPENLSPFEWCMAQLGVEESWLEKHGDAVVVGVIGVVAVFAALFARSIHRWLTLADYHEGKREAEDRVARNAPYRH